MARCNGGVGEWFIPAVLKTADPSGSVGSNPASSAMKELDKQRIYEHDLEISPAFKYCQPIMLLDLKEFLRKTRRVG